MLKEPFEKRRHLARYFTSLVSAAFFTERERGDEVFYVLASVRHHYLIVKDFYQLSVLLTFVGSVSVLAVAFYCWKSKAENLLKIKQALPDTPASLSDFSNMSSQ